MSGCELTESGRLASLALEYHGYRDPPPPVYSSEVQADLQPNNQVIQ